MLNRSNSTKWKLLFDKIEQKIHSVFNNDFFSFYEGVIEGIDEHNAELTIRVPDLDDDVFEGCKIVTPCNNAGSVVQPTFEINSRVIIGFKGFKLNSPIVFGQVNAPRSVNFSLSDKITLLNGTSTISVSNDAIKITNGNSELVITSDGITLNGDSVTAGSNNLLVDDIGEM